MDEQPRRILFLIPNLRGGGAERVIVTLLRHMDRSLFRLALGGRRYARGGLPG